jgi:hypothetical protein
MPNPEYNSVADNKSGAGGKQKEKFSPLAQDSFDAFKPFINVLDCGISVGHGPFHLITKEDWALWARHKAGERGLLYEDGTKFRPYQDIHRNIFSPWHIDKHIEEHQTTYFTSGKGRLGLFYLDIDAHHPWQTDEYRAKKVLEKVFPFGYFRASNRGQNGYLKVRYQTIREFNELAGRLEKSLKRLFLNLGILCDIEIKGTITTNDKSGSLAKLPFQNRCHCYKRDETDSWNYPQLEKFKACPVVKAGNIEYIARRLENMIDEEKVRQFEKYKNALKEKEKEGQRERSKNGTVSPKSVQSAKPPVKPVVPTPTAVPRPVLPPVRVALAPLDLGDPDAFKRNHADIKPFVRAFWKEHRRYPTTQEALDWIKANNRFSGLWEQREKERARRVGQILDFTEQTFDPKKLSQGDRCPISLKLGQFSWWVRERFGSVLMGTRSNPREFNPVTMTAPVVQVSVPANFVETFLAVVNFCLQQDPLANKAVPTNRIKKLWEMVEGGAAWNQQYYQVVRDKLNRMGIIRIFDRKHRTGKAWRWESGECFPEQDYREEQRRLREEARMPTGEAGSYRDLVGIKNTVQNFKVHNTPYGDGGGISRLQGEIAEVRGPP